MTITGLDLKTRHQIYRFFADHGRAPADQEIADLLGEALTTVRLTFHKLHARHMIFLEPGTDSIRMANPFSAVPTRFRVKAGHTEWWANCAWDSFGIPAALHIDAHIQAGYPDLEETVELTVENGAVDGKGHVIYFPLPFRQWYDDLIFT